MFEDSISSRIKKDMKMKNKQSYVTIGKNPLLIYNEEACKPDSVRSARGVFGVYADRAGKQISLMPQKNGRSKITYESVDKRQGGFYASVLKEREAFLIIALSCNWHKGWDPSLHDRFPHRECCGEDKNGNAFKHVLNMEKIIHKHKFPITWMIDAKTFIEKKDFFLKNIGEFGDEIAYMPSSLSHFNAVNYNTDKTYEETLSFLRDGLSELEEAANLKITTLAIDQFIGSVGSHFTKAAAELGMTALWGMGFDHVTCDTSMFHFGCPWNVYRPDKNNYRVPGKNPQPLWMFQWTFRDLINTVNVPGDGSGAVMFSTDVDDIVCTNIAKNQEDYYLRMTDDFLKNRDDNEMLEITIHQEDHDSWHKEGLDYYRQFYNRISEDLTPATMGEAAAWLSIKYPYPQEPEQCVRLEDPMTCKGEVKFVHETVKKPASWNADGKPYPPHVFFYNRDFQLIFVEGENIPFRYLDYRKNYSSEETGVYPAENLPKIKINKLEIARRAGKTTVVYDIESEEGFTEYPFAVWTKETLNVSNALKIKGGSVVFINLAKGSNVGTL